jgi:uncharacterized cupredoxin-like copper-binding protein
MSIATTLRNTVPRLLPLGFAALLLPACAPEASQDVTLKLTEFGIETPVTTFTAGTRYRFTIKNAGTVEHEWMLMPRGVTDHGRMLSAVDKGLLRPGATAEKFVIFVEKGEFEFACHLPGHYEGGMHTGVTVR